MSKSKIYTKTGDKGMTSLLGGTRVYKSDIRVQSYGEVDELNAHIGLLNDLLKSINFPSLLSDIQERLFIIGSNLACDPKKEIKFLVPKLKNTDIQDLEKEIDQISASLAPMTHFILPGGHPIVSQAHITRCVCRRAERTCISLIEAGEDKTLPEIIIYLNRLSDYLFTLARAIMNHLGQEEIKWIPNDR